MSSAAELDLASIFSLFEVDEPVFCLSVEAAETFLSSLERSGTRVDEELPASGKNN